MTFRFVSNVDSTDFAEATRDLDPQRDAVHHLVEDVHDARDDDQCPTRPREWALAAARRRASAIAKHFVAVSTNAEEVSEFGIDTATCSGSGNGSADATDGLGNRPLDDDRRRTRAFRELLAGFHEMDVHFRTTPLERNLPVLMGLLAVWYADFFGAQTVGDDCPTAVPQALPRLPAAARRWSPTAST